MKLSKTFIGILASASMLSFGIAPVVQATQTAQASESDFDIPVCTVTKAPGTIRVYDDSDNVTHLYNFEGNQPHISAVRSVENGTWWYTDEYKTAPDRNGHIVTYYRVSTNEWVIKYDLDTVNFETGQY